MRPDMGRFYAEIRRLLLDYTEYEKELYDKEIADGAPESKDGPHFSFARFYNWLFDLEEQ